MSTGHQGESEVDSWATFWGERTDENVELLDCFAEQLTLSICESQYRNADTSADQHGPHKFGGTACEACCAAAYDLLWEFLADAFRIFGMKAYEAGRAGKSELTAADLSVTGIGQLAHDRTEIDKLLIGARLWPRWPLTPEEIAAEEEAG